MITASLATSYSLGGGCSDIVTPCQDGGKEVVVQSSEVPAPSPLAHTRCRSKEVSCAVFPQPQTDLVGGIQRSTRAMSV